MKGKILLIVVSFALRVSAQSPSADITKGGIEDGKILFGAYLNPLLKGWSSGVNNSWFNTADCNTWGKVSFNLNGGLFFVPPSAQQFDVSELQLKNTRLAAGNTTTLSPTFFGSNQEGPKMEVFYKSSSGTDIPVSSYNLPSGFNYYAFPSIPAVQLNIGLPKKSEVLLRFIPRINVNGFKAYMLGAGIKHNVLQWLYNEKKMPVNLSAIVTFNITNALVPVLEEERIYPEDQNDPGAQPKSYYDNQRFLLQSETYMAGLVLSKDFKHFTIYTSALYNHSFMQFGILGNYPIHGYNPLVNPFGTTIENIEDPIIVTLAENRFKSNSGITIKTKYINTNLELTYTNFINISIGLGVNLNIFNAKKLGK